MKIGTIRRVALSAALLGSTLLISGCSGRDTVLAEKIALASAAADRAEKAAERAEAAATKAEKGQAPAVVEVEAEPEGARDPAPTDPNPPTTAGAPTTR